MISDNIIAGPIQNLTDARYFAARGVGSIFFDVRPESDFYIPEYEAIAIKEWIEVHKVGFCMNSNTTEENILMAKDLFLDFIVSDSFDIDEKSSVEAPGFLWEGSYNSLKRAIVAGRDLSRFSGFLVSEFHPKEVAFLKENEMTTRCFITFQGEPEEVKKLMDAGLGIHLRGSAEEKTGIKTYEELDEILDFIEERI